MRQFSFYLPPKNIVPQLFLQKYSFQRVPQTNLKIKEIPRGCVCGGGGRDDKHPLEWKKQKQKFSPWMNIFWKYKLFFKSSFK